MSVSACVSVYNICVVVCAAAWKTHFILTTILLFLISFWAQLCSFCFFFYLFFHFLYLVLMVNYLRYLFIYMVTVPVMNMKIYTYINVYIFHGCSRLSAGRRNVFGLPFHLSYCLLSESNAFTHNTHNRMTLLRYRA